MFVIDLQSVRRHATLERELLSLHSVTNLQSTTSERVLLFLSARSEGTLRTFGKYLGFWAFTLAGLVVLGAIFAAAYGHHRCPFVGIPGM
jgi:hypothetical protein